MQVGCPSSRHLTANVPHGDVKASDGVAPEQASGKAESQEEQKCLGCSQASAMALFVPQRIVDLGFVTTVSLAAMVESTVLVPAVVPPTAMRPVSVRKRASLPMCVPTSASERRVGFAV